MPNLYSNEIELEASDFSNGKPKSGERGLYLFYADWCPHCYDPNFVSLWKQLHEDLKRKGVTVKSLNCADEKNASVCSTVGVEGFPTIMKLGSTGFVKHDGPRDATSLSNIFQTGGGRSKRKTPRRKTPGRRKTPSRKVRKTAGRKTPRRKTAKRKY